MDLGNMDLSGLLSTFGIGGVLVWYLYYTTSKLIPELNDKHTTAMESIADKFTSALKEEREAAAREFAAFRESAARDGRCLLSSEQMLRIHNSNSKGGS